MKIFTKKGITQKIIMIVLIAILWNFVFPTFSRADVFGILFDPITDLFTGLGDTILSLLQAFLYNGKYDISAGLGNIFINAGWFKNNQDQFPEMKFNKPSGVDTVEIDDSNFDQISLASILTTIVSPVAGVITIGIDALTGANYFIPTIQYSVDKIFAGKVPAFDINFIQPKDWGNDKQNSISIARQISGVIAKWYVSLRNLAIVMLLSILIYIGIRIIISSSADDKAKYKQRLFDWLVAICLIFFMHYIMTFTVSIVQMLNDTIGDAATSIPVHISGSDISYNTDLLGLVRLQIQYKDIGPKFVYLVFYVALLVYTCKFTWIYMKRTVTMAFLTIIAPLVAMTYPIDKMNDGKAQAFNAWLKEYIFTALLQPFHLIIYTVLVGSALNLATQNILYSILVIAFIGPAEKLLRKFFGFDKASTPGTLSQAGAMFGGAAAWNMFKKGVGFIADKRSGGKDGNGGGNSLRTVGGNAVEDKNAPDGYDAFARTQNATEETENANRNGNGSSSRSSSLDSDDDYGNRAFLPPEENNAQSQEQGNWDNNDMYLNPESYSNDYSSANSTNGANATEETLGQNESILDRTVETNSEEKRRRYLRGALITPVGIGAGRSIKNFASRKFANGRWKGTALSAGKSALRFAGRAAVAGTVGAIGVGMGIAGDDLEDVLKYGAAGGALGYSMAPAVGRKISNSRLAQSVSSSVGRARYGSANAAEVEAQTRRLYESGELRDWAQETFLDENGDKKDGLELNELEDRAIRHYNDGFTDKGDIKKVMKLEDKMRKELQQNLPTEEAKEQARVMSETIGKIVKDEEIEPKKLSNSKYVNEKVEAFEKRIHKANPNLSDNEVKANATQIMNYIMQYYKKS